MPPSHALTRAISAAAPPFRGLSAVDVANALNERGPAAGQILSARLSVPLDEIAERLWLVMIRDNLLAGGTRSRSFVPGQVTARHGADRR